MCLLGQCLKIFFTTNELKKLKLLVPGTTIGGTILHLMIMSEKCLEIYYLRIIGPEKFIFTWKLSDMVYDHGPRVIGGAVIWKTVLICV
jgi:hypothetical protein